MHIDSLAKIIRQEPSDAPIYWWLIAAVVYGAIFWLLWYDGHSEKDSVKKVNHGTHKNKT